MAETTEGTLDYLAFLYPSSYDDLAHHTNMTESPSPECGGVAEIRWSLTTQHIRLPQSRRHNFQALGHDHPSQDPRRYLGV